MSEKKKPALKPTLVNSARPGKKSPSPEKTRSGARKPAAPKLAAVPKAQKKPAPARLDIVMVTPEGHPYAHTGGLAEVAAALPEALARLGHRVTLILPKYRGVEITADSTREAVL